MDCSLSNSKSKIFISVGIVLVSCASICSGIQCDVAKEYQLVRNKTSGEILKCPKCTACKPGSEPKPPCGSVVGVADELRICNPCKDGFYSGNEDMLQCQQCQSATCFTHQIVMGICEKDKPDTSLCTGCQKGYIMNIGATACVVDNQQTTTDLSIIPTKGLTPSNKTDGETGLSVAGTGLSVEEIIAIVICSLLVVTLPIVGLCWYFNCRNSRHTQKGKDEENSPTNTSATLLNETKDKGNGTIIPLQEEDQRNGLPASDEPHVTESTAGSGNDVSGTVMGYTPPFNNFVANNGRAISSAPSPHLTRFDHLSFQTYDKICIKFDGGAPGKDWRALACWLSLYVQDVNPIEIKENKTSQVIKRWEVATENTVAKFAQILEDHGMTYLADEIRTELKITIVIRD